MTWWQSARRFLVKAGVLPDASDDLRRSKTDNANVRLRGELNRTFGELSRQTRQFESTSSELKRRVDNGKHDLAAILARITESPNSPSPEEILRRMIEGGIR